MRMTKSSHEHCSQPCNSRSRDSCLTSPGSFLQRHEGIRSDNSYRVVSSTRSCSSAARQITSFRAFGQRHESEPCLSDTIPSVVFYRVKQPDSNDALASAIVSVPQVEGTPTCAPNIKNRKVISACFVVTHTTRSSFKKFQTIFN